MPKTSRKWKSFKQKRRTITVDPWYVIATCRDNKYYCRKGLIPSIEKARTEALYLARQKPGETFYILEFQESTIVDFELEVSDAE